MEGLSDRMAVLRIVRRLARLEAGNAGDIKPLGNGIVEMRIDHGPGYRLYYVMRGSALVLLLCGGDKSTQRADIAKAKRLAESIKE
jgi:putative addiction module killer protein